MRTNAKIILAHCSPLLCCALRPYPILAPNEVDLIHHEEVDVLNVLALLPAPRKDVPLLGMSLIHISEPTRLS